MSMPSPLVCIVGQTASGKSSLAHKLALQLNGEIICADSWTVRRKMDVGTAKPTAKEQREVQYHLIDLVDPDESFNAALFKERANQAITAISNRNKLPILVGGTGLYIDSIIFDYSFATVGSKTIRSTLDGMSLDELITVIESKKLDTTSIDMRNKRRLVRLIETEGAKPSMHTLRENTLLLGLMVPKGELNTRIDERVDEMLKSGLKNEVESIAQTYGWDCEGLNGIGYAQWKEYFLGHITLEQVRQNIIQATINLSKRQNTWFQRNKSIHWLNTPVKMNNIVDLITTGLNTVISN